MNLRKLFPFLFLIGVALMVPFDAWYTRLLGMGCLIAFVVVGVFVIATPEFLSRPDDDVDDAPGSAPGTGAAAPVSASDQA
jgi:hypothetical protein